ncbi:ArsB/NhaD family transporter [Rubrobacter indicoceani]|uniref:ArsB/NhaD family transporter n=1 Tax=Rubrobacter indicoceani TaxID=2051957 RepID=UPI000E5B3C5B|nr:ArsB/NhaD family transporter [Rubrobacter indicoceani]
MLDGGTATGVVAGVILFGTLALILTRPKDIGESVWAALGGTLAVVAGLVSVREVGEILWETHDALLLLLGMMALSAAAEKAGFFSWAAALSARAGRGSVRGLYLMVFLVGTVVTAVLSLDATAIVLTPIVYGMVVKLRLRPLPFVFACTYTANTASLFLPVSNLTNLLAYNAFDLDFARFGMVMFLPAVLAVAANVAVFFFIFRGDLNGYYEQTEPPEAENRPFFRLAAVGVGGVLAAFFLSPVLGFSIGLAALVGGAVVALLAVALGWMRFGELAGDISWGLFVLVVGLFVVVRGAEDAGLTAFVGAGMAAIGGDGFLAVLGVATGAALGSNVVNNVPMTLLVVNGAGSIVGDGDFGVVYAALIGTNVGPNLTIVGSLATLIWLSIVRGRGVEVGALDYLKIGLISTPPILLSAVFGLWVSLRLFGG